MEMMVCLVEMTADGQWLESGLKDLNPCQYSRLEHHLDHVRDLKSVIAM